MLVHELELIRLCGPIVTVCNTHTHILTHSLTHSINPFWMPSNSALHDACERDDLATVQRLLSADPTATHSLGKFDRTALHIAAKRGNIEMCRVLLEAIPADDLPRNLSLLTSHGFSVIYSAILSGKTDIVEFLIHNYPVVDLEAPDLGGLTPLHIAAEKGYAGIVKVLLDAGCTSTTTDSIGRTALAWAQAKGHEDCVALLLPVT